MYHKCKLSMDCTKFDIFFIGFLLFGKGLNSKKLKATGGVRFS